MKYLMMLGGIAVVVCMGGIVRIRWEIYQLNQMERLLSKRYERLLREKGAVKGDRDVRES